MPETLDYLVRPPKEAEARGVRMLLPELFHSPLQHLQLMVAYQPSPPRLLGAAAIHPYRLGVSLVTVKVPKPYRRRGIGTRLLEACRQQLNQQKGRGMRGWEAVSPGEASLFLRANGFRPWQRVHTFEAELDVAEPLIHPLVAKLTARGHIPPGARLVPLEEADRRAVFRLHREYVPVSGPLLRQQLRGEGIKAFSREHSVVLELDGRVIGLLVGDVNGRIARIDAKIVSREYRSTGWPNLLLMARALRNGRTAGAEVTRFTVNERTSDTMRLARRLKAARIAQAEVLGCRLDGQAGGDPSEEE